MLRPTKWSPKLGLLLASWGPFHCPFIPAPLIVFVRLMANTSTKYIIWVVGAITILKNMSSSMGRIIYPIYHGKLKKTVKPPTSISLIIMEPVKIPTWSLIWIHNGSHPNSRKKIRRYIPKKHHKICITRIPIKSFYNTQCISWIPISCHIISYHIISYHQVYLMEICPICF